MIFWTLPLARGKVRPWPKRAGRIKQAGTLRTGAFKLTDQATYALTLTDASRRREAHAAQARQFGAFASQARLAPVISPRGGAFRRRKPLRASHRLSSDILFGRDTGRENLSQLNNDLWSGAIGDGGKWPRPKGSDQIVAYSLGGAILPPSPTAPASAKDERANSATHRRENEPGSVSPVHFLGRCHEAANNSDGNELGNRLPRSFSPFRTSSSSRFMFGELHNPPPLLFIPLKGPPAAPLRL